MGIVLPRLLNYLLLTPFYTRVFPQEQYGIVTELYAYVVFLLVILTYGMETGFFRFASSKKDPSTIYSSVLVSVLATSTVFVVLVLAFIGPISRSLQYEAFPQYIRWLSLIVAIDAFTAIPFARIRLNNKPGKYAAIRIAEVLVNIGLNWFFLFYCKRHVNDSTWISTIYNEQIGVGYVFISNLAASVMKAVLLLPEALQALKGRFNWEVLKKVLKYSYPLLIAGLAGAVNEALDRVLLKHLIDPAQHPMAQLGVYGANIKIAVLMTLYVQMFRYAAEPFFFSKSEETGAKKLYSDVLIFFLLPGLMIFMMVTVYIDYFKLFIGPDFREGVYIVPIVLLANLMMGILFNLSVWYKLTDRTMVGARLVLIGAALTVLINVVFVPRYGYVASAWGHLVCYTVMVIVSYVWSLKHYRIPYRLGRIGLYISLALAVYGVDRWLTATGIQIINIIKPLLIIGALAIFAAGEWKTFTGYRTVKDHVPDESQ